MAGMIDAALWYVENLNAAIFPVNQNKMPITKNGFKDASKDPEKIREWWKLHPNASIGLATGQMSNGIVVIDLDKDDDKGLDGYEELKDWEREHGELPDTAMSITGRGGNHLFFHTNKPVKTRAGILEGIDIRGDGGYVIVPPSLHQNGNQYLWEQEPSDVPIAEADSKVFEFLSIGNHKMSQSFELPQVIGDGQRNHTLHRLACSLQARGLSDDAILQVVITENAKRCNPPLPEEEVNNLVNSALRYDKGKFPQVANPTEGVRGLLNRDAKGNVRQTIENCITVLEEDKNLFNKIRYNELSYSIDACGSLPWNETEMKFWHWEDVDDNNLKAYMEREYGLKNKDNILTALEIVAHRYKSNPVIQHINELPEWDGVCRIETFLHKYLGTPQSEYSSEIMKIFLLGALSRAFEPGCKFDYTLILEGSQGCGKSTFIRKLAMSDTWFTDNLNTVEGDKGAEKLSGIWIAEFGELLAFKRQKDIESIKAFLTSTCDNYRPPYGRRIQKRYRRCVFVGTTNSNHFLTDMTGNRRYLPIHCDRAAAECSVYDGEDQEFLADIRQVWAEALHAYRTEHPRLVLPRRIEKEVLEMQTNYLEEDTRVGIIQEYLDKKMDDRVCVMEIWENALEELGKPDRKTSNAIHDIMKESVVGWRLLGKKKTKSYGTQVCYQRIQKFGKASHLNDEEF